MHLAVCDLNQHRLIILCRMVGEGSRGRKRRLPGTIEPCKERRHCGADRCDEQLVGTSISWYNMIGSSGNSNQSCNMMEVK